MSNTGQYQSSQAFAAAITKGQESVTPNTGSLNFTLPLVDLRGVGSSIGLKFHLSYSYGSPGTFGLPANWTFDLPYVLGGKSLTFGGCTYAIDFNWVNSSNYASGLRYMNNNGLKFEEVNPPGELPSGKPGVYKYKLKHKDGSSDFFDPSGKPLEHHDIFGNYISYGYSGQAGGVDSSQLRLDYIEDSWHQKVEFSYEPGAEIVIALPDGGKTTIALSPTGVAWVVDAAGDRTSFDYVSDLSGSPLQILSIINYPTGLKSRYDYRTIQYFDQKGGTRHFPAVQDHFYLDPNKKDPSDKILRQTTYEYGVISGHTFTGASLGVRLGGLTDKLMDEFGQDNQYRYDVWKKTFNGKGSKLALSCILFNSLHSPTEETQYMLVNNDFVEARRTVLEYEYRGDKYQRTANYNQPTSTELLQSTSISVGGKPTFQPIIRTKLAYNDFGNMTSTSEEVHVAGSGYVKQKSTKNEYMTNEKLGIQIVTKSVMTDETVQTEYCSRNTPTADKRNIASTVISFREGLEKDTLLQDFKQLAYSYDGQGRLVEASRSWAPGVKVPDGTVSSVTAKTAYVYRDGIFIITNFDAGNNATVTQHDVRIPQGPVIRNTLPLGQSETFKYDAAGRLTTHVDPLGHVTTTVYKVGPSGTSETVVAPLGYTKRMTGDVLGRVVEVSDNGDHTQKNPSADPTRVLERKVYDALSRVHESTDRLGLTTRYTYDALDRLVATVDAHDNLAEHKFDDTLRKVKNTINGEVRSETTLDAYSRPVTILTYPDSSDDTVDYRLEENLTYDANNRIITRHVSQTPSNGQGTSITLRNEVTKYDTESHIISYTVTGHGDTGEDVVKRQYTLDLFGNVYTSTKETAYAGRSPLHHNGSIQLHDSNNRLTVSRNQLGQEERREYNANGWLSKIMRYDLAETRYTYDDLGRVVEETHPQGKRSFSYDNDGKLCKVQQGADTVQYGFSRDGSSTSVTYANGRSQTYTLDAFSRVVSDTDVFGVTRDTKYNELGLVASRSCRGDTLEYTYGIVSHTQHQNLGYKMSGASDFHCKISYDGFGNVRQTTSKDANSKTLLETTYSRDGRGKIVSAKSESALSPDLNQEQVFRYDGIGQLIQETVDGATTKYTYDGNSNIVARDVEGATTAMTYNKIDQRTDSGFTYDPNGRLIRDNKGYEYIFDDQDRLHSVRTSSEKTSRFEYHADNFLGACQGDKNTSKLFYDGVIINAVEATGKDDGASTGPRISRTSLFLDPKTPIASYTDDSAGHYFIDRLGSTALLLEGGQHTSLSFGAYGAHTATTPGADIPSSFGYRKEFYDQTSGLIYLRSRYYSPASMSFISMDTRPLENRYAYCEGDPVNYMDPTGHSRELLGTVSGMVAGIGTAAYVASVVAGLFTNPLVGIAIAGAAGGLVGSLAEAIVPMVAEAVQANSWGNFTTNLAQYGHGRLAADVGIGAAGGAIAAILGFGVGHFAGKLLGRAPSLLKEAVSLGLRGAVANASINAIQQKRNDGTIGLRRIGAAAGIGFIVGATFAILATRAGGRGGVAANAEQARAPATPQATPTPSVTETPHTLAPISELRSISIVSEHSANSFICESFPNHPNTHIGRILLQEASYVDF